MHQYTSGVGLVVVVAEEVAPEISHLVPRSILATNAPMQNIVALCIWGDIVLLCNARTHIVTKPIKPKIETAQTNSLS